MVPVIFSVGVVKCWTGGEEEEAEERQRGLCVTEERLAAHANAHTHTHTLTAVCELRDYNCCATIA